MRYWLILSAFFICFAPTLPAQTLENPKLFEHTLSIQVNELIRQIINLDVDNTVLTNPYLLNYTMIHSSSKFGITAGIGYDYSKSSDKESPGNQETTMHDVNARIGVARKCVLSPKFYMLPGLDFIFKYEENNTTAVTIIENTNFTDSTMNVTTSIDKGIGGGIQLRLCWDISKFLTLSTEATFYFMQLSEKDHALTATSTEWPDFPQNNNYTLTASNDYIDKSEFKMLVPVSIFLGIKF